MSCAARIAKAASLAAALLATSAFVAAQGAVDRPDEPPDDVLFERDIGYCPLDDEVLRLNLAMPKDAADELPAVILIHGGAWRQGDRSDLDPLAWRFAQAGYVAATVGYRFCPAHPFPAQIQDVKCAVRFLRANRGRYHIDADRIGAMGFSAGAHLAMLLGTMDAADGFDDSGSLNQLSSKVAAVVSLAGPTDLELPATDATRPLLVDFLGGTLEERRDAYRRASPITYLNAGDAPMLLFQGTNDPLVPPVHATRMAEAMQEAGVEGRVELMVGAGHGDWTDAEFQRTEAAMVAFFRYHLGNELPLATPEISPSTPYFVDDFNGFEKQWYSGALRAMGEPSLLEAPPVDVEVYRFLWLRSFHHPIAVRITRQGDAIELHAVELDGAGGYDDGRIARRRDRSLGEDDWRALQHNLEAIQFWSLPAQDDRHGTDGAEWIIEGCRGGLHHATDRWSPEEGAYYEAGRFFLRLSGIPIPERDIY